MIEQLSQRCWVFKIEIVRRGERKERNKEESISMGMTEYRNGQRKRGKSV